MAYTHSWEPGNGTHYDLVLVQVENGYANLGAINDATIAICNGRAMALNPLGGVLAVSYVAEKLLGVTFHDAAVFTEMIGFHLNRLPLVPEEAWYREAVKMSYAEYMATQPNAGGIKNVY